MRDPKHPIWFILFCLVMLFPVGMLYSNLMYKNGADLLKDGGLIGLIGAMTAGYNKLVNS